MKRIIDGWKARGIEDWPFKRARGIEGLRDSLLEGWKTRGQEGWLFNVKQLYIQSSIHPYLLDGYTSIPLYLHTSKRPTAFTMAEILVSLTIIGIIAAITLPSLIGNIKEKTWATQRKALYSRMSQAISMLPSINGYGVGDTWDKTRYNSAKTFVTNGLSKVMKINNICDYNKLSDCGISSRYKTMQGETKDFPTNLITLNDTNREVWGIKNPYIVAAGFETANGESIAVFYNPYCLFKSEETDDFVQPRICANFIYDLNGKKGPNKVGKDMGFITALYPVDSVVVAPMPLYADATTGGANWARAISICKENDRDTRLPDIDELTAMYYNKTLIGLSNVGYWSSSVDTEIIISAWRIVCCSGKKIRNNKDYEFKVRCVKRF